MNSITAQSQEQILPESFKERLLLLSEENQSIKKFPKILTFQIEEKKVSKKFLTKKKGRKKKSQEIKQEEEKGEKIVHSKFSNDINFFQPQDSDYTFYFCPKKTKSISYLLKKSYRF